MRKRKSPSGKIKHWPPVKSIEAFRSQYLPDEPNVSEDSAQVSPSQFGEKLARDSIQMMKESLEALLQ